MAASPEPTAETKARTDYAQRWQDAQREIADLKLLHTKLVWLRTLLFFGSAACLLFGYVGEIFPWVLVSAGWLLFVAFFAAIVRHEALRLKKMERESDCRLYEHLTGRLDRNWSSVPSEPLLEEFKDLPYADDLDVGGKGSLLSLLSLATTHPGKRTLQAWVSSPPSWQDVLERQLAVKRLVPERNLRISIVKTIRASVSASSQVYGLAEWCKQSSWLDKHTAARTLSYIGPAIVLMGFVILIAVGPTQNPWLINSAALTIGAGLLMNIAVTMIWGSWIHDIFRQVTGEHQAVYRFASVFESLANLPDDVGLLDEIRRTAAKEPLCATKGFAKLLRVVRLANLQRDVLMYMLYLVLQLLFLWDFRILRILERWKLEFGTSVAAWFESLGRCEALISVATLADDYSQWAFPSELEDPQLRFEAKALGHPLIPDDARVDNDFCLHHEKPLLLVTGSNMAGKSTFMRAVGLNMLLARTGSPVCATEFKSPHFELASSIRVRDDLHSGVSFFMAELHRLKEVVDTAQDRHRREAVGEMTPPIMFLLDEVLQGTNSRERQIAVVTVLEKLLASGAVGLISTHDLDLATVPEIEAASQVVHFREYFETDAAGNEVMRFDYRMRQGATPTTNALKLLQLVGLGADDQ